MDYFVLGASGALVASTLTSADASGALETSVDLTSAAGVNLKGPECLSIIYPRLNAPV